MRRRFQRGIANFLHLYRPLVDRWLLVDNSRLGAPVVIAYGGRGLEPVVVDNALYEALEQHA